jgi:hypothetical protein
MLNNLTVTFGCPVCRLLKTASKGRPLRGGCAVLDSPAPYRLADRIGTKGGYIAVRSRLYRSGWREESNAPAGGLPIAQGLAGAEVANQRVALRCLHCDAAFQESVFLLKGRQRSRLPAIKRDSRAAQASPHLESGEPGGLGRSKGRLEHPSLRQKR